MGKIKPLPSETFKKPLTAEDIIYILAAREICNENGLQDLPIADEDELKRQVAEVKAKHAPRVAN